MFLDLSLRGRLLGAALVLSLSGLCASARAQADPASYAVMSLVGDKLTIVHPRMHTGSHLDTNDRQEFALPDDSLDGVAARAVGAALQRLKPGAQTKLYTTRDTKLFALQEALIDADDMSGPLAQSLKELLAQSKASHFVLVTKYRADARMQLLDGNAGNGRLAGLGFYVDRHIRLESSTTGESNRGFLAPYAYVRVTLLDAATLRPLRQAAVAESQVVSTLGTKAQHAWDVLDSKQKVSALHGVLTRAVDDAVEQLLRAR
jgi:hypothetical protein